MIALLGSPPKELVGREKEGLRWKFRPEVENSESKLCASASEFFGGPFFDSEGNLSTSTCTIKHRLGSSLYLGAFMRKDLIPNAIGLQKSVLSLEGKDKDEFLRFVQKMLRWLPEKRKSAKELLEDPWLRPDSM